MSRSLFAAALLMFSGIAAAVPVQIDFVYSDMFYTNAVRVGSAPGEVNIRDDYTLGIMRDVNENLVLNNASGGSGSAYTGIFQQFNTSGDDQNLSANFSADLTATAQLTGPMTSPNYAVAETRFQTFGMQFQVLEPVLYTGSFGVFGEAFTPFESFYFGPYFESGSILQPGTYAFTVSPFLRDPSLWIYNEVTTAGDALSRTASANYGFSFSAIPTPATLPLVALALGFVIFGRYRARARAS